jgi:hypothetical protein
VERGFLKVTIPLTYFQKRRGKMKQFKTIFIGVMISLLLSSVMAYAAVPNMVGQWSIKSKSVCYENIFNPNEEPIFYTSTATLIITKQKGRTFTGYIDAGTYKIKVTGAIDEKNLIKMQLYGDNNRDFLSGTLYVKLTPRKIKGTANSYEEVSLASVPSVLSHK